MPTLLPDPATPERTFAVEELSRGAVGLFDADGRFHSLTPWLVWQHCKRCEQPELFAFARYEDGQAEYLALATGHPWSSEASGRYWQRVMKAP